MKRKMNSRRGETLVETLVAVILISLAAVMLYGMASTAARMNYQAEQQDKAFYDEMTAAESHSSLSESKSGFVTIKEIGGSFEKDAPVIYYTRRDGDGDSLKSYAVSGSGSL